MKAIIVGAGAQGRVVLDIVREQGRHDWIGFADDQPGSRGRQVNGAPVIGSLDDVLTSDPAGFEMIVAVGNPLVRLAVGRKIYERGGRLFNAVHPSAVVMPSARIGLGNMIAATAVVNTNTTVGDSTIINTGAVVEHDCLVADGAVVGPGAHLGARAKVARAAFVSTGAIVLSRISIGECAVVGAGAVVTKDLPDRVLALGVPARVRECLGADFDWNRVL